MTTPRQHADLAVRYFMDKTTNCWARNDGSNSEWTLMPDPRFNEPGLEYYVGHEPPPTDKHTIDTLRAQLAEAQMGAELERALQQAAKDLPAHFVICVNVERDAGWVQLYGSDGDIMEFALEDLTLAEQVRAAIDAAKGEPS